MDVRFFSASLTIHLQHLDGIDDEDLKKEYRILSDFEEDAVGQWLKLARARGETADSDAVLLKLIVELHKKVDQLTALVKNEERKLLTLDINSTISKINFEYFKLEEDLLQEGEEYYCRIEMPIFPKREMPMFIKAVDKSIAQILLLHEADQKDWNAYVTARERIEIRELKARS